MSVKDNFVKKLQSQIDAWNKELEAAKAEAEKKEAQAENETAEIDLKEKMMDQVRSLQANINSANKKNP